MIRRCLFLCGVPNFCLAAQPPNPDIQVEGEKYGLHRSSLLRRELPEPALSAVGPRLLTTWICVMSVEDTLNLVRQVLAKAGPGGNLAKATWQQPSPATTGLQSYDLEGPSKKLYPVLTPIRNRIPRVKGAGGSQANWKAVTGLNVGQPFAGIAEGRRGQRVNHTVADYYAAYRTIGLEGDVTFEAELAAEGFEDIKALNVMMLLQSAMVEEERLVLGGNSTYSIGAASAPTLTAATAGGSIAASTAVSVIVAPLSFDAYRRYNSNVLSLSAGTTLTPQITVTPTDGIGSYQVNSGFGQASGNTSVTTGSGTSTNAITAKTTPVRGAYGYAWFWGTAGSEKLGAITPTSQVTITTATGIAAATAASSFSSDTSPSSAVFDGLLTMAANPTYNGYWTAQTPGNGLTGDGAAGIDEFDTALLSFWRNWRIQPDRIILADQEMINLRKKITSSGGGTQSVRFAFPIGANNQMQGGGQPTGYVSPLAMSGRPNVIPFELHPDLPPGTVLFETDTLPYPVNGITNLKQIKCRRDWYQLEWPLRSRTYEYGVYADEVLQHYAPFSLGVITNIANA
jgi:hypothetical protein